LSVVQLTTISEFCIMKIQEKFGIIIKNLRKEQGISLEIIERLTDYFQIPISDLFKKIENYG